MFGTSLIRGDLLSEGRLGIINLHGGLSPEYRGADCTFWALYNGEPEKIGCTLHYIDAGIDTGRLIAHISPEVREGDGELELFWRAVRIVPRSMAKPSHGWHWANSLAWCSQARAAFIRSRTVACAMSVHWRCGWLPACWRAWPCRVESAGLRA